MRHLTAILTVFVFLLCSCKGDGTVPEFVSEPSEESKISAAVTTASSNPNCTAIVPFYWEIGNATSVLASGSAGNGTVTRTTNMPIASATKWLFGAYVIQRLNGTLDNTTEKHLRMLAGYTSFGNLSCIGTNTVQECANVGTNSQYTAANDNKFFYGGGHFQKWAVDNAMGTLTRAQLRTEFQTQLGADVELTFGSPQLAGGVNTNAANYARFLQKVLGSQLLIRTYLGANSTCTLPAVCPSAISSPVPVAWHYSYGHWVEDDESGDGSFSSAGLFGFYPWINASKTLYGIISRNEVPAGGGNEIGSGWASYLCGREIRQAYETGVAR
ncbi:hypothetical protein AZI85_14330 [Bdellovibrio bacteriovorus]|uniref:Penicillin-binding protein n=1 Tax=Bdellovibrio bacteriovorus TaxID=959 RepID=A0A150WV22_BDEBC|nr:hypothetical protein [Bdellovibrio bacteriovorus]KYG70314.1 hypothetical protein AZI85_14330 [Bdellovibrio bacteriovorus]